VAVFPRYRNMQGDVSVQLYRGMYVTALEQSIEHLVSVLDLWALERLTRYLGVPFVPLAGTPTFSYLGSSCSQAVYGGVESFYREMNRRRFTVRGFLARDALRRLVKGSDDHALLFGSPS
jgi:hypothetical protein